MTDFSGKVVMVTGGTSGIGRATALAFAAAGASVAREFYINDRGNQMNLFGASVEAAALGLPVPADGYHGAYIADLAQQVVGTRTAGHAGDDGLAGEHPGGHCTADRPVAQHQHPAVGQRATT